MAEVITMPRLSDTMTEGKVVKWNFKVGDTIKEGDILAEIETDKAIQDFESEYNGVLLYAGVEEGNAAEVDTVLAIIGKEGEDISSLLSSNPNTSSTTKESKDTPAPAKTEEKSIEANNTNSASTLEIPKGVNLITMPRLSDTMEEGKVMKWNFNVGDSIKEGDIIVEIETDKAVQDFESEYNGTLLYQGVKEGESAKVDHILTIIGPSGTDVSGIVSNYNTAPASKTEENTVVKEDTKKEVAGGSVEKNTSSESQTSVSNIQNTGRVFASPLAKKLAEEKGINISSVTGTGENGRIIKKDVETFVPGASANASFNSPQIIPGKDTETENSQVRNIIAKRLAESKFTAPHYYLEMAIDMDNAIQAREQLNSLPDTKISFNDMVIKAAALALRQHPQVNSSWGDSKITHHGNINIGVAVAIEEGLLVPVLNNADFLSLPQISASVKDLAGRARERKLKADEMEGSTFSISNLGMFGIEFFTSIINQPNSCILSIGAILEKPVVKNGNIVVGNVMKVTMACDHRVVDGATGSQYLQTFKDYLENPLKMFL